MTDRSALRPTDEKATRTFGPRPPRPTPAPERRRRLAGLMTRPGLLLTLVIVAALGLTVLTWPTGGARSVASPATGMSPYADVLRGLDARRAAAFATGESEALSRVYVPGSAALRTDQAVLAGYAREGRRVAGLRHELVSVVVLEESASRVVLRVVDRMPAFRVLAGEGRIVERHVGRGERSWRIVLERTDGGWRCAELSPA